MVVKLSMVVVKRLFSKIVQGIEKKKILGRDKLIL